MQSQKHIQISGKFCRVLMLTFLLSLSLILVQAIILEITRTFFPYNRSSNQNQETQQEPISHQELIENSDILFLPDGTVNLSYRNSRLSQEQQCMIYDLNDNLLWQGKELELPDKYLKWSNSSQYYRNYNYLIYQISAVYTDPRRSIIVPVLNNREILNLWRYNYIKEYFENFDKSGNIIGYCGSNGFINEKSQIKPLKIAQTFNAWVPTPGGGPIIMWADKSDIYQIDFRKQTFKNLLHLPDDEISDILLHNWMDLSSNDEYYQVSKGYRPSLNCRTKNNSVYVVLRDPNESFKIKVPEVANINISNVTATYDKIYMRATTSSLYPPKGVTINSDAYMKWSQERMKKPIEFVQELYEVDSEKNIKLINKFESVRPPLDMTISREALLEQKITKALAIISPAFYDILGRLFFRILIRYNQDYLATLIDIFRFVPNNNVYSYLLSLILAGIVFIHAWPRRKSRAGLIGWVIFAALFNIVGLLVYLAFNFTPTIKCHKCNKKRGLNTPQCPHCNAELSIVNTDRLSIITEN
jgi:hypothetical protein